MRRLVLSVFTADGAVTHPLPDTGRVTIGRGADNTITIDDASVSRQHAAIEMGPPMAVEDLGSANGTRVRLQQRSSETVELVEAKLDPGQRRHIAVNEPFNIGSTLCVVREAAGEPAAPDLPGVIVRSAETKRVYELAARIAEGPINVLVLGETGSGKEVLAQSIHRHSPRAKGPFVVVNCAALPEALAESELFGHEKGAFTGATVAKEGLFEAADHGTLFLDEVGELTPALQVKLLRVLEDGGIRRVGATTSISVDVRVVAATNRDLAAEVKTGTFRQDLYFRLNGITLTLPPLRERAEELYDLAGLFAERTSRTMGREPPRISPDALTAMRAHAWPGNVRELRNVIERAVVLSGSGEIKAEHLMLEKPAAPEATAATAARASLGDDLGALEKKRILEALEKCGGNQTRAAEMLGMPRRTLVMRLGEYGVTRPRKK